MRPFISISEIIVWFNEQRANGVGSVGVLFDQYGGVGIQRREIQFRGGRWIIGFPEAH